MRIWRKTGLSTVVSEIALAGHHFLLIHWWRHGDGGMQHGYMAFDSAHVQNYCIVLLFCTCFILQLFCKAPALPRQCCCACDTAFIFITHFSCLHLALLLFPGHACGLTRWIYIYVYMYIFIQDFSSFASGNLAFQTPWEPCLINFMIHIAHRVPIHVFHFWQTAVVLEAAPYAKSLRLMIRVKKAACGEHAWALLHVLCNVLPCTCLASGTSRARFCLQNAQVIQTLTTSFLCD